jgi:linoleoyl-CoA desaturase
VSGAQRIDFHGGGAFYGELRTRVRRHLDDPRAQRRVQRLLYVKSGLMLSWAGASWALLVFWTTNWWQAGLLAVSLGLALAGIGFNITHDANHGSYSPHRWLNRSMRWTLDLIGGSSYVWRVKHNVVHHTFTNISGADGDIEQLPFMRLAPDQRRRWFHRYQHVYTWPLYGAFAVKWQLLGDLQQLRMGQVEGTPLLWPRGRELLGFWLGKLAFVGWAMVVPALVRPVWQVAVGFGVASFVMAFVLAVTFQLAHCLEEADFSSVEQMGLSGRTEWARHQVASTVNFAPGSPLLSWYLGGLNFQIEHHLFSRVCHGHYPAISPIVREVCARHGVPYQVHPTAWAALGSHARWLRRMGRPPESSGTGPHTIGAILAGDLRR